MNIGISTHNIIKENVFTKIRKYTTIKLFNITMADKQSITIANTTIKIKLNRILIDTISQHTIINNITL